MTRRPCPCCGDADEPMHFLHRVELAPIAGVTVINDYDVAQCGVCGMCFATGIPDQAAVSAYYSAASKYTSVSESDRKRHEVTAAAIRRYISPPDTVRILDVGAGARGLAEALAPLTVFGVDTVCGMELDIEVQTHGLFDGVILSGVLEHVVDVKPLLRRIRTLLKPDGWLWTEVPDAGNWPVVARGTPFQEFSSEHVNYFTDASLAMTLFLAGFQTAGQRNGSTDQTPTQTAAHLTMWARPRRCDEARAPIVQYIKDSTAGFERYVAAAEALPASCVLWGAGTLTRRLWPHLEQKVLFATDSNPAYHGHSIGNCAIVAPFAAAAVASSHGIPLIACTQGAVDAIQADAKALGVTAIALLDYAP